MTRCKVVWDARLELAVSIDRGLGIPPSVLCRSPTFASKQSRTALIWMKTRCPKPIDDGGIENCSLNVI